MTDLVKYADWLDKEGLFKWTDCVDLFLKLGADRIEEIYNQLKDFVDEEGV